MKKIKLTLQIDRDEFKKKLDIRNGEDGVSPSVSEVAQAVSDKLTPLIPKIEEVSGEQIIEKINTDESEQKIKKEKVEGIEEIEKEIASIPRGRGTIGGTRGIQLYTNGTKRGMAQMVNIIPGIGVSLTYDYAFGRNDITINASASTSVLTATGTINDSNLDFTFTSEPAILVINGASYRQTGGAITWTWTAGTLTATLSSAVGSGGSIFGLA